MLLLSLFSLFLVIMTSRLDPAEEGVALPADELSTSGLGSEQISRRRLAFRPPVEQRPLSTNGTRSESTTGECSTSAGVSLYS